MWNLKAFYPSNMYSVVLLFRIYYKNNIHLEKRGNEVKANIQLTLQHPSLVTEVVVTELQHIAAIIF